MAEIATWTVTKKNSVPENEINVYYRSVSETSPSSGRITEIYEALGESAFQEEAIARTNNNIYELKKNNAINKITYVSTAPEKGSGIYGKDIYKEINENILESAIKRKVDIYKDPKAVINTLIGLSVNRGLRGHIFVVQKDTKSSTGFRKLFPIYGDMGVQKARKNNKNNTTTLTVPSYYAYNTRQGSYSDFLVTNISMPQAEIVALEQGFGEYWDVHFYGQRPLRISVSGVLLNAYSLATGQLYDWAEKWYKYYSEIFRGSLVAKKKARTYFTVGNYIFTGYILNTTQAITREEGSMPFAFSMIITNVQTFSEEGYSRYIKELEEHRIGQE